jgi:hypothetical protein
LPAANPGADDEPRRTDSGAVRSAGREGFAPAGDRTPISGSSQQETPDDNPEDRSSHDASRRRGRPGSTARGGGERRGDGASSGAATRRSPVGQRVQRVARVETLSIDDSDGERYPIHSSGAIDPH